MKGLKKLLLGIVLALTAASVGCGRPSAALPIDMSVDKPAGSEGQALVPQEKPPLPDSEEPWTPDILDRDDAFRFPDAPDDSLRYEYDSIALTTVSGSFSTQSSDGKNGYRSTAWSSMAICRQTPFPYGTISCGVKTVAGSDTGLVFAASSDAQSFWEGVGVSYYFFFLSRDGAAYLGKTADGQWSGLKTVSYSFDTSRTYTLKAVWQGGKICCYVDGALLLAYRDPMPLTGTQFGIRSGASGAEFVDLALTNDFVYL